MYITNNVKDFVSILCFYLIFQDYNSDFKLSRIFTTNALLNMFSSTVSENTRKIKLIIY